MRRVLAIAAAACTVFFVATEGRTFTLELSDATNNATPASALDALLEVEVSGSTLTLTVTNQSAYRINELYFNVSGDVTGLALNSVSGGGGIQFWTLQQASGNQTHVGGFGTFDYALLAQGARRGINPGQSAVFTLDISGVGPFEVADFVEWSTPDGAHGGAFAVAKFVAGPGGDSSFGAVIPEGDSLRLFAVGLVLVASAPALGLTRRQRPVANR